MRHVVATAGHVDHGKSTLVRALTGIEPDRWEQERRRGLTIDLGFVWTTLPSGADVAFVDVPGHERFIGNMLAGLGPAPVVLFVIAADEGWCAQSADHRDAVAALGIERGLIVLTRADRAAPEQVSSVVSAARTELAGTGLAGAPVVVTSAVTGRGLDDLTSTLDAVLAAAPAPDISARVRLWIDRAFTVDGAGTVVTGTLAAGTIARDDRLELVGTGHPRTVTVRELQSEGNPQPVMTPVARVAVNLRGISTDEIARGDALITPASRHRTRVVDVARVSGLEFHAAPEHLTAHIGTAALPARLRPFDADHARITLDRELPLAAGDRIVLRDPGRRIVGGGMIVDAEPPSLHRRGDARRRAMTLRDRPADGVAAQVARRGAVTVGHLVELGVLDTPAATPPPGVRVAGDWWIDETTCTTWSNTLRDAVEETLNRDPLSAGPSHGAARDLLGRPDASLLATIIDDAGLESTGGHLTIPGRVSGLGDAEDAIAALERRLTEHPFRAPEADDLDALGLGSRELAAAHRLQRILRLDDGVVLLPTAPAQAMRTLSGLEQPFTTSSARKALNSTRRVVIPLLEHLDGRGWTRRIDAGHREVVR